MKNKIVELYKSNADKIVHKDAGAWLTIPMFLCTVFSVWFFLWLLIAIAIPLLNELYDKYKGTGWNNADLIATYIGELKMLVLLILVNVIL